MSEIQIQTSSSPSYTRPYLYPKQHDAIFSSKRWNCCEASTKSGKTVASIVRIIEWGLFGNGFTKNSNGELLPPGPNMNFWWVAPISPQARIAFGRVKQNLTPGTFRSYEHPEPQIRMVTGPILTFKSADNPDSLYGEDVYGAIIDEASRCKADAWYAVRSTLTATGGPAVCIGNVKGKRNWFYEWCRRIQLGQDPNANFSRITWRDAVDAGVLDEEEIEDARRNLPEKVFQELYEALASDDTGNPFGEDHILACVRTSLSPNPPVAFGIDLAKKQDYLVVIGLDENGDVCIFERWTHTPWRESIRRIHEIVGDHIPALVDSTGLGDPVLEELQHDHGNFFGYNFTASSKQRLMEGLAVSIQSREIGYPDGPIKNELMLYEYVTTRTGVAYSAPEGYNDDCVVSLALARQKWAETQPGSNLMEFWDRQIESQRRKQELENLGVPENVGSEFERAIRQQLDPETDLNNELSQLYSETFRARTTPLQQVCISCHQPISGGERVSDGVYSWHIACHGPGAKINLFTAASGAPLQ